MITYTIDWLSCTFAALPAPSNLEPAMARMWPIGGIKRCAPRNGYTAAVTNDAGMLLQYADRLDMGTNLLCTGSALSAASELLPDFDGRLYDCLLTSKTVSRLDVAIDSKPGGMLPDLVRLCRAGHQITHAQRWSVIEGSEGGQTLYIGSRTSERMMRIYDKAAQMKDKPGLWDRIELEVKGDAALRLARALATHDRPDVIRGWINDFCRFNHPEWMKIMTDSDIHYAPSQRKTTDTREWLFYTVAPVIAKLHKQGDHNLINEFLTYVASLAVG